MKLVKTSAIALAISAMLAGPVLAQGTSSDSKVRGGVQGKSQMQGGTRKRRRGIQCAAGCRRRTGREDRCEGHGRCRWRRGQEHWRCSRRSRDGGKRY